MSLVYWVLLIALFSLDGNTREMAKLIHEKTSGGSGINASVEDLRQTLPKSQIKEGLLANMTGRIDPLA